MAGEGQSAPAKGTKGNSHRAVCRGKTASGDSAALRADVYRSFQRLVDAYGCVSVEGMKYRAPTNYIGEAGCWSAKQRRIRLFDGHKELALHKRKLREAPPQSQRLI